MGSGSARVNDAVIQVRGLGKRYRVGERERYVALRDVISRVVTSPFRRYKRSPNDFHWALRDISFDVSQGEVVGLIGRNGAGKTTLLKLLSRITRPTEGFAEVRGRVGSLLEVGTGFHPELTGRENIFLSGAILGMSRKEILRKHEAIVEFAEVARFLDTPLKHYSSGMQMRLAFSVAAHLEPEILFVDEVLAVGDMAFQKKCLGKMEEVSRSGRTIVFVSHQMNQIRRLCERVLWFDAGRLRESGPTGLVLAAYESSMLRPAVNGIGPEGSSVFISWQLKPGGNILANGMGPVTFQVTVCPKQPVQRGHFGMHLYNDSNLLVASWGFDDISLSPGLNLLEVGVPSLPLRPGSYALVCSMYTAGNNLTGGQLLEIWNGIPFLSVDSPPLSHPQDAWAGLFNIPGTLGIEPNRAAIG